MNFSGPASSIRTHRFGVNYVPTRNWWYSWNDFDESAVSRDLDSIAGIGLDHLRIMLLWPYFQPNPTFVSPAHLDRLDKLMSLASQRELDVCVTALNGFLSGFHFVPSFHGGESIYTHDKLLAAQNLYFRSLAETLNRHESFIGFDLGNEINCYRSAPTSEGDHWMNRMLVLAAALSPDRVHVNGVDHQPWFRETTFSPAALTTAQRIVPIHCWTYFTGALKRGGPLGAPAVNLLAAMTALVRAYAGDPKKPVWVQEYGASLEWMDEITQSQFLEKTTLAAIEEGVSWFTWWCSHDIDQGFEFASLEYGLGMFTTENKAKPYARVMKEIIEAYRGKPVRDSITALPAPPSPPADTEETWRWLEAWTASRRSTT